MNYLGIKLNQINSIRLIWLKSINQIGLNW
jgi:hypothetical protein